MNSIRTSFTTISILGLLIFSCIAYVAHAQTTTPQERFAEIQALREAKQASTTAHRQEIQAERKAALSEKIQERLSKLANSTQDRMNAVIERLTMIAERMDERSQILADQGADMTTANTNLDNAKLSLSNAHEALTDIDIDGFIGTDNPRGAWQELRAQYVVVREDIKTARDLLRATLEEMKSAAADINTRGVNEATENGAAI